MSYYVFIDLDETLINYKSMMEVVKEYLYINSAFKFIGEIKYQLLKKKLNCFYKKNKNRIELNKFYYKQLAGVLINEMYSASSRWVIRNMKNLFNSSVLREIEKHRQQGAEIVIVTGSFEECAKPIMEHLNLKHLLCAKLEKSNGRYTGKMISHPTIGVGKVEAILNFLKEKTFVLKNSYAYADHESDIPMLSLVENPVVVNGDPKLMQHAKENGWSILTVKGEVSYA